MGFETIVGIVVFLALMVLIFLEVPIFVAMLGSAIVGFLVISHGNPAMALVQCTTAIFEKGASYNYAVLPLFMVVGALAGVTGIASDAFDAIKKWLGRVRGGLLYTVVASNAVFGACSGSPIAGCIVFGKLSLPELNSSGYDESNSLGCITASGALSTLIPPSTGILMFCLAAPSAIMYHGTSVTLSVGTALIAGIIPGILTAIALCITIKLVSIFKQGTIPPASAQKVPMLEKLKTLKLFIPILLLFGLIIGGATLGWFSATVGGAIGAVALFIYALVKRIPLKKIASCLWESAVMEGSIFPIIVAGSIFSAFISQSGLANYLSTFISSLNAPAPVIFLLVMLLYIVCGCVMDIVPVIIITVPVVFPVLCGLGYSPYAVVISLCFMSAIAGLTPPIGMSVFATSNALHVSPSKVFRGVLPYFLCEVFMVFVIAFIPAIVTFLPSLIG